PSASSQLAGLIRDRRRKGGSLAVSGARHAMGGQQFASNAALLDIRGMDRILSLDKTSGILTCEAGTTWPKLMAWYLHEQGDRAGIWSLAQKQTGVDNLTLGGTLAANAHGRSLQRPPIIS